jgi:hypothetical protein
VGEATKKPKEKIMSDQKTLPESTSIVVQPTQPIAQSAKQTRLAAFTPGNLTEAIALAKMMAGSDMVPKDYKGKPANIIIAMQFGSEIGLAPMQSLQSVAVINGRPCLWGDGALGLVQGHPDFEDIQETTEGTTATCVIKRRGRTPCKRTFSDDDATRAGLIQKGGPWNQYRGRMRQMRARGFALRDSFSDVLKGISIAEEAMDIPVDTSDAKKQRESMTFDVSSLQPSAEPNRGHENTGMDRSQKQAPAKPDPVMCGECRTIDGHTKECPHYSKTEQDAKTSKPMTKAVYQLKSVKKAETKSKNPRPYLTLEVVTAENVKGKLYVWHGSLHEFLINAPTDAMLLAEVSQNDEDGKKFINVEHILELGGVQFVNDKPAEQATMPEEVVADEEEEDDEDQHGIPGIFDKN